MANFCFSTLSSLHSSRTWFSSRPTRNARFFFRSDRIFVFVVLNWKNKEECTIPGLPRALSCVSIERANPINTMSNYCRIDVTFLIFRFFFLDWTKFDTFLSFVSFQLRDKIRHFFTLCRSTTFIWNAPLGPMQTRNLFRCVRMFSNS